MNAMVWTTLDRERSADQMLEAAAGQGIVGVCLQIPETWDLDQWKGPLERWLRKVQSLKQRWEVLSLPLLEDWKQHKSKMKECLCWAAEAGVGKVMLRPGIPEGEFLEIEAASNVAALCDQTEKLGLPLLLETSGPLSSPKRMKDFLTCVGRSQLQVAWNIHHTFLHEPLCSRPGRAVAVWQKNIGLVVVRDSLVKAGIHEFRLLGFGNVPVLDSLRALEKADISQDISFWVDYPDQLGPKEAVEHCAGYFETLQKLV